MKTLKMLFYIIINILISAGTVWLAFSYLNLSTDNQIDNTGPAMGVSQSSNDGGVIATVIPDKMIIDSVISAGDVNYERVTIIFVSDVEVSLSGWKLEDADGNSFTFPPISLYPGSSLIINSKAGADTVTELFWGSIDPIWETGEVVYLNDPAGYPQAMYVIP